MQIHEITRRNINEAAPNFGSSPAGYASQTMKVASPAAPKAAAAPAPAPAAATTPAAKSAAAPSKLGLLAKAVGSHIASRVSDYAAAKTGISPGQSNPYGDQQKAAATAAAPVIKSQAEQQQKLWNAAIAKTQQQSNVQSPTQFDSGTKQGLEKSLMNQIHRNLLQGKLGSDYKRLPQSVNVAAQQQANDIVKRIESATKEILDFNSGTTAQEATDDWQTLSQATYDAMSLIQFASDAGAASTTAQPNAPAAAGTTEDPAIKLAADQLLQGTHLTAPQLQGMQEYFGKLGTVTAQDPKTKAALQAAGFKTQ